MKASIYYFVTQNGDNPVKNFLDSLEKIQKAKIFRIFQTIENYGLEAILRHTKKLTGLPIYEIRILGKDNIRILYILIEHNNFLLLHGFIKKTQKTVEKELTIALTRYEEWKKHNKT